MRAEFFVNLQMISLGEKMQIDLAHDRAVGVGIVHDRRRAVPAGQVKSIIDIALHSREDRLEKSLPPEPLGRKTLLLFPRENDGHFLRVRTENADREIVADRCGPRIRNGSGCAPARKRLSSSMGKPVTSKELMREPSF